MTERIRDTRIETTQMLAYGKHLLDVSLNSNTDTPPPLVVIGKSKSALIHNIHIDTNEDGITILYFETNKQFISIYDTQGTLVSIASPETLKDEMTLPKFVITFKLVDLIQTDYINKCVITQVKNQYHCAFIPSEKCLMTF